MTTLSLPLFAHEARSQCSHLIFVDSNQALGNSNSQDVSLGDLDGDGDLDAFVANWPQPNKIWLNDGNGTFTDSGQI